MFTIYADNDLLYSTEYQTEGIHVLAPLSSVEIGKAGSVDFILLPGHYLYNTIEKLLTKIYVYMDEVEIFNGRVLNWDIDFYKQKTVHCEGNLTYLLDSLQPPRSEERSVETYFASLILEHNLQVEADKRFVVGVVTIDAAATVALFESASYRDTRAAIDTDLLQPYGGFLRTRTLAGVTYLDYIKDYGVTSSQTLEFASNILDMNEELSSTEFFTVFLPTGDGVDTGVEGDPVWPLTIESVNGGSKLLENLDGISKYGRIVHTESFGGITDAATLKATAETYFARVYEEPPIKLTIKAIDLHFFNTTLDRFMVGYKYQVTSAPHGINVLLTCLSIQYDFENIENTELTLGTFSSDPEMRLVAGQGISQAMAKVAGGPSGGAVGKAYKYITEGDDWLKLQAKKIDILGENITLKVDKTDGEGMAAAINLSQEGTKIFGRKVEIVGENGILFAVGGHYNADFELIFDDLYATMGIDKDGTLNYSLVNNENVKAMINASEESVKIYGNKLELMGDNGFKVTVGGHMSKDLEYILDEAYATMGIDKDGTLNYELVHDDNVITSINASAEGVKIKAPKITLTGTDGIIIEGALAVQGDISGINATISNLITGTTKATKLWATTVAVGTLGVSDIATTTTLNAVTSHLGVADCSSLKIGTSFIDDLFSAKGSFDRDSALTGSWVFDNIKATDGILTGVSVRQLTAADVGALGATAQAADSAKLIGNSVSRTSATFVTGVSFSTKNTVTVVKTLSPYETASVISNVILDVDTNTYYFYT